MNAKTVHGDKTKGLMHWDGNSKIRTQMDGVIYLNELANTHTPEMFDVKPGPETDIEKQTSSRLEKLCEELNLEFSPMSCREGDSWTTLHSRAFGFTFLDTYNYKHPTSIDIGRYERVIDEISTQTVEYTDYNGYTRVISVPNNEWPF